MSDREHTSVAIAHRLGRLELAVSFNLTASWTVLFGASGSGKTTVLRTIQGFVQPNQGRVLVRGSVVVDTGKQIFVPVHRRLVRTAGQDARLFAHMTVRDNLRYGTRADGEMQLGEVLRVFRIESLPAKMPQALSGGERQRVSVARAVLSAASGASLLLLDEPFTGLELALRDEVALELRELLQRWQVPVLSVTHDVSEAFLLGAEVLRLQDGRITEQGPVDRVLAAERSRLLAQLKA